MTSFLDFSLTTERLLLTPTHPKFREHIFREFTPDITRFMMPRTPKTIADTDEFILSIRKNMEEGTDIVCAVLSRDTEEFLGHAGVHGLNTFSPELGVWMKKSAQGQGYGKESLGALKEWVDEHVSYDYLVYPVDRDNLPSRCIADFLGGAVAQVYDKKNEAGRTLHTFEYWIYPPSYSLS